MNVGDEVTRDYATRAAHAVYLECPELVAADISRVILSLLARAEKAEAERDEARKERDLYKEAADQLAIDAAEASDLKAQVAVITERAAPFTRIASWGHLTDQNSDKLPVKVTVVYPNGENVSWLTAKDFRLLMDATENLPTSARAYSEERGRLVANQRTPVPDGVMKIVIEIKDRQHDKAYGAKPLDGNEAHAHVATLIDLWNRFVQRIPGLDESSLPIRTPGKAQEHGG